MALNVHGSHEVGKILMWVIGFAVFAAIGLTEVPHWLSTDTANRTVEVGSTARMIQ